MICSSCSFHVNVFIFQSFSTLHMWKTIISSDLCGCCEDLFRLCLAYEFLMMMMMTIFRTWTCPVPNSMLIALSKTKNKNKKRKREREREVTCAQFEQIQFSENLLVFRFFLKVSFELCSLRAVGRLFHSLGAALENALTPDFFVVSSVDTRDLKTRVGGGPQMMYLKIARY